jgi:group I intron endonuclease
MLFNIVYKTVNLINGKYYIGVHKTNNLNDGYMGCGHIRGRKLRSDLDTKLYRAFKKYGDDNFNTEILHVYESYSEALAKETEIVDLTDPLCYNSKKGGVGGFAPNTNSGRIINNITRQKMSESAKTRSERIPLQTNLLKTCSKNRKGKTYSEIYGLDKGKEISIKKSRSLTGRKLSIQHRQKMSINRKGKDCGKCTGRVYVWDEVTTKLLRILKSELDDHLQTGNIIERNYTVNKFRKVKYVKIC